MLVAGNHVGKAVVQVLAVDEDGQVHFTVLPGTGTDRSAHHGPAAVITLGSLA
jgi:hypothetical protein